MKQPSLALWFALALPAVGLAGCSAEEHQGGDPAAGDDAAATTSEEQTPRPPNADEHPRNGRSDPLMQPAELAEHLASGNVHPADGTADVHVLDARDRAAYDEGHVEGAQWLDLARWREAAGTEEGLQDAQVWAELIGDLGIEHDDTVVVYGDYRSGEGLPNTARIWWLLRWVGVENAALLDGGWGVWSAEAEEGLDRPISDEEPDVEAVAFEPDFQERRLATLDDLLGGLSSPDLCVLDARTAGEYVGEDVRGARGGHIPGATHLEWVHLIDEDGRFLPRDALRELFAEHGIGPDERVVTHCQSGGRASVEALALELAGYEDVANFYAGWAAWSADEEAPVVEGHEPGEAPEDEIDEQTPRDETPDGQPPERGASAPRVDGNATVVSNRAARGDDDASTLRLAGRVVYTGAMPEETTMVVPEAGEVEAHTIIVDPETGGLKNAVVWIEGLSEEPADGGQPAADGSLRSPPYGGGVGRGAASQSATDSAEPPVIDQLNFTFIPHVLAVRAGRQVRFTSSDQANHNVHAHGFERANQFNTFVGPGGEYIHRFVAPERRPYIMIGCEVHNWMRAWVYVFDHPYYAVTGPDGRFEIPGIPQSAPGGDNAVQVVVHHADGNLRWEGEAQLTASDRGTELVVELAGTPEAPD